MIESCICDPIFGVCCALHGELANKILNGGMDRERAQMTAVVDEYRKHLVNRNGTWLTNMSPEDLATIAFKILLERVDG